MNNQIQSIQLDLFIPPLHNDSEYWMAKNYLDIVNISKRPYEDKERKEIEYRIKLYQIQNRLVV